MIEAGRWHLARGHPLRGLAVLAATVPVLFGLASDRPAITVDGLWIAEPPPGANVAAGYGAIVNHGAHNDRLVSVSAEISHTSEFHGMTMREDGVVEMRPFDDGLEIPPYGPLVLEPGGIHIMFMGLRERPVDGDRIVVTLVFDRAGSMEVVFPVTRRSSAGIEQDDGS